MSVFDRVKAWMKRHPFLTGLLAIIFGFGYLTAFWATSVVTALIGWTIILGIVIAAIYVVSNVRASRTRDRLARITSATHVELLPGEIVQQEVTGLSGRAILTDQRLYLVRYDNGGSVVIWSLPDVRSIVTQFGPREGVIQIDAPAPRSAAFNANYALRVDRSQASEVSAFVGRFHATRAYAAAV